MDDGNGPAIRPTLNYRKPAERRKPNNTFDMSYVLSTLVGALLSALVIVAVAFYEAVFSETGRMIFGSKTLSEISLDDISRFGAQSRLFPLSIGTLVAVAVTLSVARFISERVFLPTNRTPLVQSIEWDKTPNQDAVKPSSALEEAKELALASRFVADTLFSRSGVYLFLGVLTAMVGVIIYFFVRTWLQPTISGSSGSFGIEYAVYVAQNAGVLFLCELIAFFFLRQSRSALDEFRHFDSIARSREDALTVLMLFSEDNSNLTLKDLLDKGVLISSSPRLAAGETTEIVEYRKLEKTEIDLLNRLVDLIAAPRKN